MATVTEIASGVYRINVVLPDRPVSYSLFLLDDDSPTLIETSFAAVFDEVKAAVESVMDLAKIERIVVPHFEGDECGALNKFLAAAPNAVAVCSPIGSSSIRDFTGREPVVISDGEVLTTGSRKLRFFLTPYVHAWDSLLAVEETQGTLFSSDLFIQPGHGKAFTDEDLSEQMVDLYKRIGLMPSMGHIRAALDKMKDLDIKTIACHHGSVLTGNLEPYYRAVWEQDFTGLPEAGAYAGPNLMQE
ncbi:MAG: MBL fold metallo-hydrolase [Chloroflexi bacterium]|nr:MBL fold metallo-hydrolase [Chloroflexota bacterium]